LLHVSDVVANMELLERSEVLFPSFPLHSSPSPLLSPTFPYRPSPPLPYLVAIISTIFLKINLPWTLHFFEGLLGGTLLYHRSPCPDIIRGNGVSPQYLGNGVPPRSPSTTPLLHILLKLKASDSVHT